MEVTVGLLIGLMPILLTIDSQRIRRPEKRVEGRNGWLVEQSKHTQNLLIKIVAPQNNSNSNNKSKWTRLYNSSWKYNCFNWNYFNSN